MEKLIHTNIGTSSGSSTEEDPPSGFARNGGLARSINQSALCDFRIIKSKVDKDKSPLFRNFTGEVYSYLPYHSLDPNNESKEFQINHRDSNSAVNIYMSEVAVIYGDSGEQPTNKKDTVVHHVTELDRNHIFLGQSIWLSDKPKAKDQGSFERGEKVYEHYVIHDVRPVHKLTEWDAPFEDDRIPTKASNTSFARINDSLLKDMWIVVARPIKWALKHKGNDYYIGLVETTGGQVPQVYEDVTVYKCKEDSNSVEVYDNPRKHRTEPVAIFHNAACIELKDSST